MIASEHRWRPDVGLGSVITIAKMEETMSVAEVEKVVTWHFTDYYICKFFIWPQTLCFLHVPDLCLPPLEWP